MIHQATQEISNLFTMRDVKHRVEENGKQSYVEALFTNEHVRSVSVRFISTDENNDVAVRASSFGCVVVPEDRRMAVMEVLNQLNGRFRFAKFCLRDDRSISVEYDLAMRNTVDAIGTISREIFSRFMNILDEAYFPIMRAVLG
ncbi:MAG: YbjN domain-containing protein [Clostridia bacterium]|nr:YbjN domain-containing protein [Clostridia bacterium]